MDFDHPSALCNKLAAGELDVALVSSFEFLRNPIYRIVDDVSISSDGPVYSVVVAHRGEIGQIEEIELDPASETSANLLYCLIAEFGLPSRLIRRSTAAMAWRGGNKNRPSRATAHRRSSHPFPTTVRERIFFLGPRRTVAEILSDFRLFTLSGLFAPKSAIQNKSQTVSAISEMETLPLSMI